MRTLGFTGTRNIYLGQSDQILRDWYHMLAEHDHFVTGGCRGWDAHAGLWLFQEFQYATHRVILPSNRSQVESWWQSPEVRAILESDDFTGELIVDSPAPGLERTYKDRNGMIVSQADRLLYCAEYPELHGRSRRSGTWQTVRMARRESIPVDGVILHA